MKKLLFFTILIGSFIFAHQVSATTYYVDFTNGLDANAGTATTTAWQSLDKFTEAARTAGDTVIVRRGMASTTNVTDLNFTSDGTIAAPLVIQADYTNLWSDFASSTQTYTVAAASSTMTTSGMTGIVVGKWVFVQGDNPLFYSYEVATVSSTSISFYIPYKGDQSGSGLTLNIMPSAPQWNVATGDFQWVFDLDNYWKVQGIDIRGTDINGTVYLGSNSPVQFIDCIFQTDGVTAYGMYFDNTQNNPASIYINKSRFLKYVYGMNFVSNTRGYSITIKDSLFNGSNTGTYGMAFLHTQLMTIINTTFQNHSTTDLYDYAMGGIRGRNINLLSTTKISQSNSDFGVGIEDYNNIIGNSYFNSYVGNVANLFLTSTSTTVRSGGGATSLELRPTTNLSSTNSAVGWDFSKLKLFEYPIYADTTSKTYSVYFYATSTTAFTADPTASELWIECDYYATASGANRKVKKSTGLIDFNGSATWQALSVTCQPTQTGILYLRGYYGKTKEAASNFFFMDVAPVIQ